MKIRRNTFLIRKFFGFISADKKMKIHYSFFLNQVKS